MNNNEMKLCKYCQTPIPKKAKICPNCRKKQGMGCLPIILIVIALIVILAIFGSGSKKDSSTTSEQPANTEAAANDTSSQETASTEAAKEKDNVVTKGDTFEANGLKVTIDDINTSYEPDDEYGIYELADGLKYIAVSFTFENTGDTDAYVSIYDFTCYADNSECEQQYIGDSDFINTNLSSGRNVSFTTYYAVPEDAQSIELEYTSNIWTDEKIIVKVQ